MPRAAEVTTSGGSRNLPRWGAGRSARSVWRNSCREPRGAGSTSIALALLAGDGQADCDAAAATWPAVHCSSEVDADESAPPIPKSTVVIAAASSRDLTAFVAADLSDNQMSTWLSQ